MTKPGSSKTPDDQVVDNSESLCGQCKKLVKNENQAMECEICQQWYHIRCQGITKAEYECIKGGGKKKYLSKLHWYCQTCERMAVNFMRTMTSLHVKQKVLEERIYQLEEKFKMKVNQEEVDQLREEIKTVREGQLQAMEEKQRELEEKVVMKSKSPNYVSKEDMKKNVMEEIETRLQEKEAEKKARKDRKNNLIVFGIKENQATNQKDKQTEDLREIKKILNEICEVQLNEEDVAKVIRMGKYTESKKRPVIITIKREEKKKEIFQNLQKLRRYVENITITHDLTQKQRKELQELINEAKRKEECDPSSSYIYRVRGPPWGWYIKKITKKTETLKI